MAEFQGPKHTKLWSSFSHASEAAQRGLRLGIVIREQIVFFEPLEQEAATSPPYLSVKEEGA